MSSTSLLVLLLFISSSCQQNNDVIKQTFQNAQNVDNSKCEAIVGNIKTCSSCFTCDHPSIAGYAKDKIERLSLKRSDSCADSDRTQLCCIAIENLNQRQLGSDDCGRRVVTRGRRSGPKSILESEIPWHLHIYSANKKKLCAGTYISSQKRSILVPASCVRGKNAQDLRVSFRIPFDANDNLVKIDRVIVHPDSSSSDIAIIKLSLSSNIPNWVKPACLSGRAPSTPAVCMSITDSDNYVNLVIPQNCTNRITSPSQICSGGTPGDYIPEFGAGLVCEAPPGEEKELIYELHGIHLSSTNSYGIHTSTSHVINWIDRQLA